jgi:hypothetical protein
LQEITPRRRHVELTQIATKHSWLICDQFPCLIVDFDVAFESLLLCVRGRREQPTKQQTQYHYVFAHFDLLFLMMIFTSRCLE